MRNIFFVFDNCRYFQCVTTITFIRCVTTRMFGMLCFSEIGLILPENCADLFGTAGRAPPVNQKREQLLGLAPLKQERSAL